MMAYGRNLTIDEATENIKRFEDYIHAKDPSLPRNHLAIGQKLDLSLLKDFIDAIDTHPKSTEITAVRIYLARSVREGEDPTELFDIVMVPVLTHDEDLHRVYDLHPLTATFRTLVGSALPCPNVCPPGGVSTKLNCP